MGEPCNLSLADMLTLKARETLADSLNETHLGLRDPIENGNDAIDLFRIS